MAYTRTGRPPGRPKTKKYVTLMARVPQDVADQAKRYARLHRHTMSDVLRESLLRLLQEEDPSRPYVSDTNGVQEIMSDTNIAPMPLEPAPSGVDYDASKYTLGKLCPRRHRYKGTEKALLRLTNRHCLACDREKFHERKQAKRQAAVA